MMSNLKNEIFPELTKKEFFCVHKAVKNEYQRWESIIEYNKSKNGQPQIASDYENDSIRMENLLDIFDDVIENNKKTEEISFGKRHSSIIIESGDHEIDLWKQKRSDFNLEDLDILKNAIERIKDISTHLYGPEILELAHYERGRI